MAAQAETQNTPYFSDAAGFWERGRILYNAILVFVVLLWIVFSWPHFRPALTLSALGIMSVLAVLANLCYSTAYLADIAMNRLAPEKYRRRFRSALWILGMLFALLLENYWIADEIYPDVHTSVSSISPVISAMLQSRR